MKLKEYIKYLKKLEKNHGDAEVWYAIDDEGNGYGSVLFGPSIVYASENTTTNLDYDGVSEVQTKEFTKEIIILN